MKSLFATAGTIFLSLSLASTALAHPPAYGPDGLIPHSHTKDGTVISGSSVSGSSGSGGSVVSSVGAGSGAGIGASASPACPAVDLTAMPHVRPTGLCIRLVSGRPVNAHGAASTHGAIPVHSHPHGLSPHVIAHPAPVAAPRVLVPVGQPVAEPVLQTRVVHQPVIRHVPMVQRVNVVRHVPVVQPVQVVRHVPVVQHVPLRQQVIVARPAAQPVRVVQPVHAHPTPAHVHPVPVPPMLPQGPSLVTAFEHEGERLSVVNTGLGGQVGIVLIKILDADGKTRGSWWTTNGHCYTAAAFEAETCSSQAHAIKRFTTKLKPISVDISGGPGPYRSPDPCDHYSKLEAMISEDTSGFCGY